MVGDVQWDTGGELNGAAAAPQQGVEAAVERREGAERRG
jgi:hypothetical protein